MQNTTLTCHTFDNLNINWGSSTKPVLINLWAALFAWIWYEAYQWMISSFKLTQASISVVGNSLSESGGCRLRTQRGLLCKCELIRIYISWWGSMMIKCHFFLRKQRLLLKVRWKISHQIHHKPQQSFSLDEPTPPFKCRCGCNFKEYC